MDITKVQQYYKKHKAANGKLSDKVIINILSTDDEIVHGAMSINKQLPKYLQRHTEDWDIYTDDEPEVVAKKIETALDKKYGGNYFTVEPAKHEGTYKVKSIVTGDTITDITFMEDEVTYKKIGQINYTTLDYEIDMIKKSLATEENKFRHIKDLNALQRIKIGIASRKKSTIKKPKIYTARAGTVR